MTLDLRVHPSCAFGRSLKTVRPQSSFGTIAAQQPTELTASLADGLPLVSHGKQTVPREVARRRRPAGYGLHEEPHALRLARLALREEPQRSEYAQSGAWHPHQQRVGICDKARQRRHTEPQSHREDLRADGFSSNDAPASRSPCWRAAPGACPEVNNTFSAVLCWSATSPS